MQRINNVHLCKSNPKHAVAPLILTLLLSLLIWCGCQSPVSIHTALSEADFRDFGKPGRLSISGHIDKYAARPVYLDPATPYATELFRSLAGRKSFSTADESKTVTVNPIMLQHRRTFQAEADGYFICENVAPGPYYVSWFDSWMVYDESVLRQGGNSRGIGIKAEFNFETPQGKWHFKRITVREGQDVSDINF